MIIFEINLEYTFVYLQYKCADYGNQLQTLSHLPYQSDGRQIVKIGVNFDSATRTLGEWKIKKDPHNP